MREIKFKFWSKTENKFLDDYYICIRMGLPYELEVGQTVYDEGFSYNTLEFPTDDIGCEVSSSDVVVLQYTGLKDKNGKEIYEGDILRHVDDKGLMNWIISFNDGSFVLQNIGVDGYLHGTHSLHQNNTSLREVIGNIYENQELLNQTK